MLSSSNVFKILDEIVTVRGNCVLDLVRVIQCLVQFVVDADEVDNFPVELALGRDKEKMVALVACIRKMLHIVVGVLKNQTIFDPNWKQKKSLIFNTASLSRPDTD